MQKNRAQIGVGKLLPAFEKYHRGQKSLIGLKKILPVLQRGLDENRCIHHGMDVAKPWKSLSGIQWGLYKFSEGLDIADDVCLIS